MKHQTSNSRWPRLRSDDTLFEVVGSDPQSLESLVLHLEGIVGSAALRSAFTWCEPDDDRSVCYLALNCAAWPQNWLRAAQAMLADEVGRRGAEATSLRVTPRNDPRERYPLGVLAGISLADGFGVWADGPPPEVLRWVENLVTEAKPRVWLGNAFVETEFPLLTLLAALLKRFPNVNLEQPLDAPLDRFGMSLDQAGRVHVYVRGALDWDDAWNHAAQLVAEAIEVLASVDHPAYCLPYPDALAPSGASRISYRERPDLGVLTPENPLWSSRGPGTGVWTGSLGDWWPSRNRAGTPTTLEASPDSPSNRPTG